MLVLYPVISSKDFQGLLQNFNPYEVTNDSVDHTFLKMAACTGAVGATGQSNDGSDINVLSESLYCQVLGNCSAIYRPIMHIRNIQVLMLMVRSRREIAAIAHYIRQYTAGKLNV